MTIRTLRLALIALCCLVAVPASAQEIDPETGDFVLPPPQQQPQPTQPPAQQPWYAGGPTGQTPPQQQQEQPPPVRTYDNEVPGQSRNTGDSSSSPSEARSGRSDHSRVVGGVGFGFIGVNNVPIGDASGNVVLISAPTIGVRYWLGETIGLDIGIGLGYQGGNASVGGTSIPQDDGFAMTLHGGVPLTIWHDGHFAFQIIPEINFGFATGTAYGAVSDQDRGRSGILVSLGARAGAEIQFGFMGIPNLSLQATVGLAFQYLSAGIGESRAGGAGGSVNTWALGTSVDGEPWDIFVGSLTALYYIN